jgi:hypothetical protein
MRPSLRPPWPIQTQLLRWHPRALQSVPRRIATTSAANAAPVDIPKLILSAGSLHHNSLPSFLEYAKRTNLAADRTTYVGTHYEYITALSLLRLGFSLLRVGGKSDAGIDLIGHWVLATLREPLRVFIQCKARKISVSPCHIRELEGSFQGIPPDWKNKDVLGLLITNNKATKGTLKALGNSRWPMGFVMVSKEGLIQQFIWNRAAAERGLEGVGVTLRHTPRALLVNKETEIQPTKAGKNAAKFKNAGTEKDIQLTWMGSPIFPNRDTLDENTLRLMRVMNSTPKESSLEEEEDPPTPEESKSGRRKRAPVDKTPRPRGGMIPGKVGRPKKSDVKVQLLAKPLATTTRGRPKGSKNTPKPPKRGRPKGTTNAKRLAAKQLAVEPAPPGRPKGSKNKLKIVDDAG